MATIGGKQFINRGTSENPIYQRVGSSASIVSGGTAIDGANVSTGTDAPESPADGDLWFNETVGSLFVYIDGTGWVESNPGGLGSLGSVQEIHSYYIKDSLIDGNGKIGVNEFTEGIDTTTSIDTRLDQAAGDGGTFKMFKSPSDGICLLEVDAAIQDRDPESGDAFKLYLKSCTSESGVTKTSNGSVAMTTLTTGDTTGGSSTLGPHRSSRVKYQAIIERNTYFFLEIEQLNGGVSSATNATIKMTTYINNGSNGGGASVTTSETAPTSPSSGDLWYDTSVAQLYVYIDGTGWLQTNGGGGGGGTGGGISTRIHNIHKTQGSLGSFGTIDSPVPAGEWMVSVNWIENANTTDEDTAHKLSKKYTVPTGHWLHFGLSGTTALYAITTSSSAPAQSEMTNLATLNLPASEFSSGSGPDSLQVITGFAIEIQGTAGGGGGPRAYVAFDGTATDWTAELDSANSYNVSSIGDGGIGRYAINYENEVPNGVATMSCDLYAPELCHNIIGSVTDAGTSVIFSRKDGPTYYYYDPTYVAIVVH